MAEFLNNNIKHIRLEKKMSQQTLADLVGVDRSTISRIENNEIETTIDNGIKIAKALNISISELIATDLTIKPNSNDEDDLISKYKTLSPDDKVYIKNIIEKKLQSHKNKESNKNRNEE
jgi:transcriptional regulator with XRE-family HTH domain